MESTSFSITRVNHLRRAAVRARDFHGPFGAVDAANALLAVFDTLRLKAGFALHVHGFVNDLKGDGIIWAVPADPQLLPVDEYAGLEDTSQHPRKPGAVPLMQAIEGDGSPWSYLSASILRREAAEFGADWPGYFWTDQTILSKPPRQVDDPDVADDKGSLTGDAPVGDWTWHAPVPKAWKPTYFERGTTKEVVLHIRNPVGSDQIYQATDTYRADSYDCTTRTTVLCTGTGGILY